MRGPLTGKIGRQARAQYVNQFWEAQLHNRKVGRGRGSSNVLLSVRTLVYGSGHAPNQELA